MWDEGGEIRTSLRQDIVISLRRVSLHLTCLVALERKNDMRYPCLAGLWRKSTLFFCVAILLILIPTACTSPAPLPISQKSSAAPSCRTNHQVGFLKTLNGGLVDASGCKEVLTGVNWFGFETSTFAPHGLWARNWQDMLNQMARLGFNTIRLPYTNQLFDPTRKPQGIN